MLSTDAFHTKLTLISCKKCIGKLKIRLPTFIINRLSKVFRSLLNPVHEFTFNLEISFSVLNVIQL